MKIMLTSIVLDRLMLVFFALSLVVAVIEMVKGRGRLVAYMAFAIGGACALIGAILSWNGHDWIPDPGEGVRMSAVVFAMLAFALLWFTGLSQPDRTQSQQN
jgi:heme A synthase